MPREIGGVEPVAAALIPDERSFALLVARQDGALCYRVPGCHRARKIAVSAAVSGKNWFLSEANIEGRHGAGRPHIKVVGSLLCTSPNTWPSSCATTFRGTFGSESGRMSARRMPTSPLRSGRH